MSSSVLRRRCSMILHVNIIVQINVEFAFRERNEIFVLITNPVMSTAVAMACIPDDEARVINSHKAFANWLTKGNQCVYSRVPMLTLLKSVRSWGQLIIHIDKRLHVGYILLKGFAFAEETSNSLEVMIDYCLRRRMLAGIVATPLSTLWRR